ncbi:MAG: outer membrane protein, family [Deltaproteobacteria bacterium]|nr:outer membrane protein, family [Deltaproteobacteria bacterium]
MIGVKFTHRDLYKTGMTFDVDATYAALNSQQSYGVKLMQPHLANDRFIITLYGKYGFDPQREFFGLGNNDRGPDPASTNAYQNLFGVLALGWRPRARLALNFSVMFRKVDIRHGDQRSDCGGLEPCPFTQDSPADGGFSDMPRVHGGKTNPLSLSLVWNDRDEVIRPTQGWLVLIKASHTNTALLSDFEFTRVVGDAGYLYPWFDKRLVTGARIDGVWMEGPDGQVPFWELTDLGGSESLRGFFPHRFRGKKRLLVNLEVRGLLTEFDFYKLWHVRLDGVLFGEAGRVFLSSTEIKTEFHAARPDIHYVSHLQYSYGGSLRIALSSALVARLDVGFSEEE